MTRPWARQPWVTRTTPSLLPVELSKPLVLDQPRRHVVLAEHLDHALRRPVALVDGDHATAGREVAADVGDHGLDVAAVGLGRLCAA